MGRLLLFDWLGKTVLLFPHLIQKSGMYSAIISTVGGIFLMTVVVTGLLLFSKNISGEYYFYVGQRGGKATSVFLYLVYGVFFALQTLAILRLCGEVAGRYLLPDTDVRLLMLLVLGVAFFLAGGGLEVRARVSEILCGIVVVLLFVMLGSSILQVRWDISWEQRPYEGIELVKNSYLTSAGFGSIFTLPFVVPEIEKDRGWEKKVYAALFLNGILLLLVYLTGFGIFGNEGMDRIQWPLIEIMSCMNLQGVFLQRWDLIFVGVLLFSLFFAVGSGIYYMETVLFALRYSGNRTGKMMEACSGWKRRRIEKKKRLIRSIIALALFGVVCLETSWEQILRWYHQIGLYICVPVIAGITVLLWIKERYFRKVSEEQDGKEQNDRV